MSAAIHPERWLSGALLLVALAVPRLGASQDIAPYRAAIFMPNPVFYTDPRLAPEETRAPGFSYPRVRDELKHVLSSDARFTLVGAEELVEIDASREVENGMKLVADDQRDYGIDYFGRYELHSAREQLDEALDSYRRAEAYLTDPRDVARAYEYRARTLIEMVATGMDDPLPLVNAAREDFRQMIRLDPESGIREGLFPSAVVELYQQAYLELLADDGALLSLTSDRAQALAARYQLDRVVWAFFLRDASGRRLVLEVYDAGGRRESRQILAMQEDTELAVRRLNRAVSRYLACEPIRYEPPPPAPPGDAGRFFLQAGWGAGVFAERPTAGQFLNQGIGVTLDLHLSDNLGIFGRANVMFSGRDPEGDLLSRFTSTRLSGGLALSARMDWFRPFLGLGFELNVVGHITASDNFWCKVSGGSPTTFGPGRACLPGDLQEQSTSVLFGPYLMPGFSIDIVSPFALYLLGSFAFYISDASTNLDFPLVGEAGIEYRF